MVVPVLRGPSASGQTPVRPPDRIGQDLTASCRSMLIVTPSLAPGGMRSMVILQSSSAKCCSGRASLSIGGDRPSKGTCPVGPPGLLDAVAAEIIAHWTVMGSFR